MMPSCKTPSREAMPHCSGEMVPWDATHAMVFIVVAFLSVFILFWWAERSNSTGKAD